MASSGMLRHVALVRTDVSEDICPSLLELVKVMGFQKPDEY
jgi:hypothetical protein